MNHKNDDEPAPYEQHWRDGSCEIPTFWTVRNGVRCLGEGLLRNASVTSVSLDLEYLFQTYDDTTVETEVEPLTKYFRTSTKLRSVSLRDGSCQSTSLQTVVSASLRIRVVSTFLRAIAQNSYIQKLNLNIGFEAMAESLSLLVQEPTSHLKELSVWIHPNERARKDQEAFCAAIATNCTLERVDISYRHMTTNPQDVVSLICHLVPIRTLNEFRLDCNGNYWEPLETDLTLFTFKAMEIFLKSTNTLSHLILSNCQLDEECWNCVSNGLELCHTIRKLSLDYCALNEGATQLFVRCLQTNTDWKSKLEVYICRVFFMFQEEQPHDAFDRIFDQSLSQAVRPWVLV